MPVLYHEDPVIAEARKILSLPKTYLGWSDVGEALTSYLSGKIPQDEALQDLGFYAEDYARQRKRNT